MAQWCHILMLMMQCTLVKSSAVHSGQMQCILVKSDELENFYSLLYLLNPDYVAACSLLLSRYARSVAIIMVRYFMYSQSSNDIISLFAQTIKTIKSDSVIPDNLMPLVCFLSSVPKALTDTRTRKATSTGTRQNEVKS